MSIAWFWQCAVLYKMFSEGEAGWSVDESSTIFSQLLWVLNYFKIKKYLEQAITGKIVCGGCQYFVDVTDFLGLN